MEDIDGAIEAYKKAIQLNPKFAAAYKNLGNALKERGDLDLAKESYKAAIIFGPKDTEILHMLSALSGETTNSPPRVYVETLFDRYASNFESSLVDKLEYRIPSELAKFLTQDEKYMPINSILDLGCGTGLVGVEVRDFCKNLEGIDLSKNMVQAAQTKKIYDKLSHMDITDYLSSESLDFDCFIAADVFLYVGDLSQIFSLIKTRNRRGESFYFQLNIESKEIFISKFQEDILIQKLY